jgi:hypothetical protein
MPWDDSYISTQHQTRLKRVTGKYALTIVMKHAQSGTMIQMEVIVYATIYPATQVPNTSVYKWLRNK